MIDWEGQGRVAGAGLVLRKGEHTLNVLPHLIPGVSVAGLGLLSSGRGRRCED
jgi:hypothetical protein